MLALIPSLFGGSVVSDFEVSPAVEEQGQDGVSLFERIDAILSGPVSPKRGVVYGPAVNPPWRRAYAEAIASDLADYEGAVEAERQRIAEVVERWADGEPKRSEARIVLRAMASHIRGGGQ
jgi:hypothetical protein